MAMMAVMSPKKAKDVRDLSQAVEEREVKLKNLKLDMTWKPMIKLLSLREFRRPYCSRLGASELHGFVNNKVTNDLFGLIIGIVFLNSCLFV